MIFNVKRFTVDRVFIPQIVVISPSHSRDISYLYVLTYEHSYYSGWPQPAGARRMTGHMHSPGRTATQSGVSSYWGSLRYVRVWYEYFPLYFCFWYVLFKLQNRPDAASSSTCINKSTNSCEGLISDWCSNPHRHRSKVFPRVLHAWIELSERRN